MGTVVAAPTTNSGIRTQVPGVMKRTPCATLGRSTLGCKAEDMPQFWTEAKMIVMLDAFVGPQKFSASINGAARFHIGALDR